MTRFLAATNNAHKLEEFRRILAPLGVSVVSPVELNLDIEVEENGETFAENAHIKASAFFRASGIPSIADDSGLCVDALGGRPGVHSARYHGRESSYPEKFAALLDELKDVPEPLRTARFVSAICCVLDDETILSCEGVCEGSIGFEPAGEGGFGYDPLFYIGDRSFGQHTGAEKDILSHRGKSLRTFAALLEKHLQQ